MKLHIATALLALLAACGTTPEKTEPGPAPQEEPSNNASSANVSSQPDNSTAPDETPVEQPSGPISVECVSDLVTHGGNYYALTATITDAGALVEMVHYLAATPTSDPDEEAIWTAEIAAEFSATVFAFEAEEQFLNVSKTEDEEIYRGTMSGQSEFDGPVNVSCWPVDLEHPAQYDAASGDCLDELGNTAVNVIPWMVALRTGFGQCARFEGELTGEAFGYPTFDLIDLRGADFSNAALHFANLQDVQLEGADLRQFDFGYATIGGSIDEHTQLPELAECEVVDGATTFECTR